MMRTKLMINAALPMLLAAALTIPSPANAQTFPKARNYEAHEITLNGKGCLITDIDRGMAVGLCNLETPTRAFAWTEATGVMDLGTLGGSSAIASGTRGGWVVRASKRLPSVALAWVPSCVGAADSAIRMFSTS